MEGTLGAKAASRSKGLLAINATNALFSVTMGLETRERIDEFVAQLSDIKWCKFADRD